jgi:hypothetical protein
MDISVIILDIHLPFRLKTTNAQNSDFQQSFCVITSQVILYNYVLSTQLFSRGS